LIDPAPPVITTAAPLLHHVPGHDQTNAYFGLGCCRISSFGSLSLLALTIARSVVKDVKKDYLGKEDDESEPEPEPSE